MAHDDTVRRILQLRFTMPSGDPGAIQSMVQASAPFMAMFGNAKIRVLQNVDDPRRFVQEIEYDTPESMEASRQKLASDAAIQAWLQSWRSFLGGSVDMDVFHDVTLPLPQSGAGAAPRKPRGKG